MRNVIALVSLLIVCPLGAQAFGETIAISASADNTLYEDPSGSTSNGAGRYVFAGMTAQDSRRRALMRFDLFGLIPAGAMIQSVTLTLHQSRSISGMEAVSLHRTLASWGEAGSVGFGEEGAGAPAEVGDATWLHREWNSLEWSSPGGDFMPEASATALVVGTGFYSWSSAGMVADVQHWLSSSTSNHGWMIIGNESAAGTAKRFDSREHDDPGVRPVLEVTFVPAPASVLASAAAMTLLARRARAKC